jgi:hypothetical protein
MEPSLNFLRLMIWRWKMLTKEVEKWASMPKFRRRMHLMNGIFFVVLTQ